MDTVLITGGTGLIGTALTQELLRKEYKVIILTRNKAAAVPFHTNLSYAEWDIDRQTIDLTAVAKADHIVHLAGAGIADKRWTVKRKKEILQSRTQSSGLLVKALQENSNKVKTVVSASGIGWYGPGSAENGKNEKHPFLETDSPAEDFLGITCKEWEASIDPIVGVGKRLVKLRTALVLAKESGVLKEFKKALRFGIAPIMGNGRQLMSWIHIDDLIRLYIFAIENEKLSDVYNAVAPQIVTNKKFILQLAKNTRGKFYIPVFVPAFLLDLVVGEVSIEVLKSAPVSCEKIRKEGYSFLYPSVAAAIHHLE